MKISITPYLLCILSCISITVTGQDLRPGYIIKTAGDTTRGFVEYKQTTSTSCAFANDLNAKAVELSARDVLAYGFDNDISFLSVDINNNKRFVEVIVPGRATLFAYENYFGVVKDSSVLLLEPKSKKTYVEGTYYEREDRTVIAQLARLLSDCKENLNFSQVTLYNTGKVVQERKLTGLIDQYNVCMGGTVRKEVPKSRSEGWVDVTVFAGVGSPQAHVSGKIPYVSDATFSSDPSLQLSFLLQYTYPRVSDKLSVITGLSVYNTSLEGHAETIQATGTTTIDYTEIKWPLLFRYQFGTRAFAPYVKAGAALCLSVGDSHILRTVRNGDSVLENTDLELKPMGSTFCFAAGVTRKLKEHHFINAEMGWDTGSDILVNYVYGGVKVSYPCVMIGYTYRL